MNKNRLLACLLAVIFFSCDNGSELIEFEEVLGNVGISMNKTNLEDNPYFIVIPGNGCPSCIYRAEQFLLKNYENKDKFVFIFTNYDSEKLLSIKLGEEVTRSENVIVDKQNFFYNSGFNSMYPIVTKVSKQGLIKQYGSPQNLELWENIAD